MASTRSSSPAEASSPPSPQLLTPRSKLKQLFAGIDTSSDEDNADKSSSKKEKHISFKFSSPIARNSSSPAQKSSTVSSSDDDEDEVVRPRGRLAARMQAATAPKTKTADVQKSPSTQLEEDARKRVKAMLQNTEEVVQTTEQPDTEVAADDEDEDVAAITRPRKLVNRARRSETPESVSPAPREESPMFLSPDKGVSPSKAAAADNSDSDSDVPADITKSSRFQALVAKKRAERLAREAEAERKKAARLAVQQAEAAAQEDLGDDEDSDITDDEGGRTLSQKARPTRKAGRKAMEEMNRETQRMSRNMQLAHEAKTRKKITKASLFERFNFRPQGAASVEEPAPNSSSRPSTPVSVHDGDVTMGEHQTPPSSPPAVGKETSPAKAVATQAPQMVAPTVPADDDEDMPSLDDLFAAATQKRLDKGKGVATDDDFEALKTKKPAPLPVFKVKLPMPATDLVYLEDSDEDSKFTVSKKKSKLDAIFDRAPAKQEQTSRSLMVMQRLAQVTSPSKANRRGQADKAKMTAAEMQFSLVQRARAQAKSERDRRLEQLKAKGVHIQTAEEREKELADIEDIVGRARQEAEELMQRERDQEKKDRKERGEDASADPLAWDDSDASWDEEKEEEQVASELELSGSEDEGEEDADEEGDEKPTGMFDDEAESADDSEDQEVEEKPPTDDASDDDVPTQLAKPTRRSKKRVVILSDDEDEDEPIVAKTPAKTPNPKSLFAAKTPNPKAIFAKSTPSLQQDSDSPQFPTSVLRSANKTFIPGLAVAAGAPAGLGLTQIFAGTMNSSPAGFTAGSPSQPMPTFDGDAVFPDSQFSHNVQEAPADTMVMDSQPETQGAETQGVQLHYTQSQMHDFDSLLRHQETQPNFTQLDTIEPSQDGGFQQYTPLKARFVEAPPSTVQTVMLDPTQQPDMQDSPIVQRKGKLRSKASFLTAHVEASDEEAEAGALASDEDSDADVDKDNVEDDEDAETAFSIMKEAAALQKKQLKAFKKKSKAKEMVEEQADESEDEYAGLGGADGEDSDDESTASVKEMIDDKSGMSREDKAKIAAFYADKERANDEKAIEKLYRDITSGMLRRKRRAGEGYDGGLSDSDDGGEARRRMKRRQFDRMQKALFADERVSKVAENPRNQAFLRTIEDHGSDDDDVMDFLFEAPAKPTSTSDDSQTANEAPAAAFAQDASIPDSQPALQPTARLPAAQRRTKEGRKPSNIGELRESLSNLLDDPHASIITATDLGSDSDGDADKDAEPSSSNKENQHPHPRRTRAADIVDRVSLRRQGSSSLSSASGGRMAFATAAGAGNGVRGVPALLRRATTNSLKSSGGPSGSGMAGSGSGSSSTGGSFSSAGGFGQESKIRKAVGKRSGVNYFARENDRLAAMAEKEKRREARKFKGVEGRGKVVGGLFGGGKFE